MNAFSGSRSRLTFVWLLALLQGCAHCYVDADGTRHMIGFMALTLPASTDRGGEAIQSQSIGLSVTRSEAGGAFVLGYSDTTMAFARNNSLVSARSLLLDPGQPRAEGR